jgi:hypothetical protein
MVVRLSLHSASTHPKAKVKNVNFM